MPDIPSIPVQDGPVGEFTDHYELVRDEPFERHNDALTAAGGDFDRVWFIRHGDGCDCDDMDCECEDVWDVELAGGQFVNRIGYFVTTKPCKEEHRGEIFTY